MKYISDFREGSLAPVLACAIAKEVDSNRHYRFMEFCGGHTHTIHRYGIPGLLPKNVEMVHGPGCPVCVLPIARVDHAVALSFQPNVILCSYGDMLRVPGTNQETLLKAKARGADVRMIYSVDDALSIAQKHPDKEVVFFAIGFETTTPPTAHAIIFAKEHGLKNFTVFCNHVLTPIAMECILRTQYPGEKPVVLDGFIGPAHVSIIIGSKSYEAVGEKYQKPIVISGFEPLDVMHSILMLIRQLNEGRCEVENQYIRAVNSEGNIKSQQLMGEVFELRTTFEWRGLGFIENSALKIKEKYKAFDAEYRFPLTVSSGQEHKACDCGAILRGAKKPTDCKLFAKVCTPENPLGSCMVSSEGACSAVYAYGPFLIE
ncbi:hydrogenase formation protein HypD [Aquicella lusitana]|uniref:Hydrogenase maturation factor n=1 Tax=Aquicella lusitana TaxID=254246 RepID=A0A370GHY3_9COXI|nr:hydrogenase formation protein HypD [Aquicella lusitana]RDI43415.1 hydrogenase maturation carbamoyl dehydratase HypE /hydrogenase maturation protein HypD [Aquicella lusitana]VVC73565.1 Hydrogenase expression/formation protein HypD [Aquicella lusitana]